MIDPPLNGLIPDNELPPGSMDTVAVVGAFTVFWVDGPIRFRSFEHTQHGLELARELAVQHRTVVVESDIRVPRLALEGCDWITRRRAAAEADRPAVQNPRTESQP